MKVATILGTRPEITKLSALLPLLDKNFKHILIHTGQHYDYNMDTVFFEELHLKEPDYTLNIGSHSHGKQTGRMLEKIEEILIPENPDLVIVLGDTNTTLAGALAAAKLHFPIMHLEAGCRSFNRKMPEELNRIGTDHLSDYLIAPDRKSIQNLLNEGIPKEKTFSFGSTVFDVVLRNKQFTNWQEVLKRFSLNLGQFILLTLHRAENTNNILQLKRIIRAINQIAETTIIVFPAHPRTKKIIQENNIFLSEKIKVIEPQSYLNFLAFLSASKFCISDSGGVQEEALALNIPCLIPRDETEWIRIVEAGKNILVGTEPERIVFTATKLLDEEELQKIKAIPYPFETGVNEKIIFLIKKIEKKTFPYG